MNDLRNPYIAGAPVVETSMFFGREDVFRWIENSLTGKFIDHILVIHGQRRVGKTTVLKQIPNFLPKQYIQVFYDLQGRTNTTLNRFLWWMASEIVRTLNKQLDADLPRPKRDQFADPETFITEFIPSLAPQLQGQTLLLTFDEFDTLSRPDIQDTLARPLITFFRQLFDVSCLNFIFSIGSSGNKLENMQASYTNFFKTALYRKVSFLSKNECRGLITKPVKGVITYQPKAVQRITEITSGHPYFTQLTCHELFSRCQTTGSREITPEDVDNILDDVIERGTVNLKFVWDEATDLEKWVLAVLGEKEGVSQKEINTTLKSQGVRFVDSDLNSAILHLRDKDVLTKDNHLVIHLMKLWLEINRPMDRVREELVQTNPIANRYIEIGDELRDRHQFDEAVESYQRALEFQDNNISALLSIANIFLSQQKYTQAVNSFEKALQVNSEHIAARQGYCQSQLALGDQTRQAGATEDAIAAYQAILNLTPVHRQARQNLAAIYREQAEAYLSSGDDQQALESLRLAIEMTPEDEELKARHQGIIDEKKAALVKSWFDKAQRALRRKRWDEAAKMAQEALKVDPDDEDIQKRVAEIKDAPRQEKLKTYRKEAETALAKGDYPKAITALETASLLSPEDTALTEWLESTRSDQQQAQLKHYQTQAEQAQGAGDWEAAIDARQAAIQLDPDDETLAEALVKTKEDQKNAQLRTYQEQAESAQAAGDWEAAIAARQAAIKLNPENETLIQALAKTKTDQKNTQLMMFQTQAEKAQTAGHWDAAIAARQAAIQLDPENDTLAKALVKTKADQKNAQIKVYQKQAESAQAAGDWEAAIAARQAAIKMNPEDEALAQALAETQAAQLQAKLDGLLAKADSAFKVENWSEAVSVWEAYLEEMPEDAEKFSERLSNARKYARISADYAEAQDHIHKKQFGRAIGKLQGIIAQDPTYKATSRLLVEAVEANQQRKPIWKRGWLYGGVGVILLVIVGVLFNQQISGFIATKPWQGLFENAEEQVSSVTPTTGEAYKTLLDGSQAHSSVVSAALNIGESYHPILDYIESQAPTFEDDFWYENQEWGRTSENNTLNSHIKNYQLVIIDNFNGGGYSDSFTAGVSFSIPGLDLTKDFALVFDFAGNEKIESINMRFGTSLRGDTGYQIAIEPNSWELSQLADSTILDQGNLSTSPADRSTNHLLLIVKDAYAVLYLNDETVFERNDLIRDCYLKRIEVVAIEEGGYVCFDNFQLWDLEEVEIGKGIAPEIGTISNWDTVQAYMDNQEPTFEDDFSAPNTLWDDYWSDAGGGQLEDLLNDGHLSIPDTAGKFGFNLPVRAKDFVAYIEVSPQSNFEEFSFTFKKYETILSLYSFTLEGRDGEYNIRSWDWESETEISLKEGNLGNMEGQNLYKLVVIAKDDAFAVFWDEDLLFFHKNTASEGNILGFFTRGDRSSWMNIDNIMLWDLEGDEFFASEEAEQEPEQTEPTPAPGAVDTNEVDGAEMVYVPAGDFLMGGEASSENPEHTVYLDAFWIYQHEVTNAQIKSCIDAGYCVSNNRDYSENNYPAVYIEWNQANTYCQWAGGRLPTEAEWEKAARGTDGRTYPWGEEGPTCSLANDGCAGGALSVGSYPAGASPYGAMDMAGNVCEWVSDWADDNYITTSQTINPQGASSGTNHVVKGGSYGGTGSLDVSDRSLHYPSNRGYDIGFRCVIEGDELDYQGETDNSETETTSESQPSWVSDFAEPILEYVSSLPPSVEDPFLVEVENEKDTYGDMWVFDPHCNQVSRSLSVSHGEISTNCQLVNQAVTFQDYVVTVDLYIDGTHPYSGIYFNKKSCWISLESNLITVTCDEKNIFRKSFSTKTGWRNLRFIVKGSRAAIYLDEQPVGDFEIENKGLPVYLSLGTRGGGDPQFIFSNFKAWSLTYFNFP